MHTIKRTAISVCRRETLKHGLGTRGEVLGGVRYNEVLHHCRVAYGDNGQPKLITED
jgi:hypothetical protein